MCAVSRRPVIALLVIAAAAAAGCSGGSSSASTRSAASSGPPVPTAQTLPPTGTAKLPDGRIYTVAAPGTTLKLDDISLYVDGIKWRHHAGSAPAPPGTRVYAVARVTVGNPGAADQKVGPTQIWLLAGSTPFLAAGGGLIGRTVPAGGKVSGLLTFPLPRKTSGGLLVYRFADAAAIAKATHVGVARYRS
jgi:hypothetical protein